MAIEKISFKLGGFDYEARLTIGAISAFEQKHGSIIKFMVNLENQDFKIDEAHTLLFEAVRAAGKEPNAEEFADNLLSEGALGIITVLAKVITPFVMGKSKGKTKGGTVDPNAPL